jgi:PTS system sucrose-specific IIC component
MYNMIEAQMVSENPPANIWMPVATAANVGQGAAAMAVAFKIEESEDEGARWQCRLRCLLSSASLSRLSSV